MGENELQIKLCDCIIGGLALGGNHEGQEWC